MSTYAELTKHERRVRVVIILLLGLTSLQVGWDWLRFDRRYTRLSLALWSLFLLLLGVYYVLLHRKRVASLLMRLHRRIYLQITRTRIVGLSLFLLGICVIWYAYYTWGKLLAGFDFGTQYYKYHLIQETFPNFVVYDPLLNGGYENIGLAVGTPNLFLITYPITMLFSVELALKVQAIFLMVLLPILMYISARLVGFSNNESLLAAIFALVITPMDHEGFMDLLFTGLLPYTFSAELSVIVFAMGYRVFVLQKSATWGIPAIILCGALGSFHPLFALIMGPLFLATVISGTIPLQRKIGYCLLISLGLLILNGPAVKEILAYKQGGLVSSTLQFSARPVQDWLVKLEDYFFGFRVALVSGAWVGLRRLLRTTEDPQKRRLGGLLLFAMAYYVLLIVIGDYAVPLLQPFHFVAPLSFFVLLALAPAWSTVETAWTRLETAPSIHAYSLNATLGLLAIFLCWPFLMYFVGFPVLPQTTTRAVAWLTANAARDGRILLDQHTRSSGAKPGFYRAKTERPIIGFSSPGRAGGQPELNRVISDCLNKSEYTVECTDLLNIRYIVSYADDHKVYPREASNHDPFDGFTMVREIGNIRIYENTRPGSYFLAGQGRVEQRLNALAVAAEPSEYVILKFFWIPGLRTIPPLELESYPTSLGIPFIKVRSNYREHFVIVYRSFVPQRADSLSLFDSNSQ
jgi:hypothetical protein